MNEDQKPHNDSEDKKQPGFCSATCTDRDSLQREIAKPDVKTSDIFATCNLPKRFEHPHWFNGYGCQVSKQHPFYRTSASEYGWYPPGWHSVPSSFFPRNQEFSSFLAAAGMYRNYSLNTGMDPAPLNVIRMEPAERRGGAAGMSPHVLIKHREHSGYVVKILKENFIHVDSGYYSVPSTFFPAGQTFTYRLFAAGMYRNYSLNTAMDPPAYL